MARPWATSASRCCPYLPRKPPPQRGPSPDPCRNSRAPPTNRSQLPRTFPAGSRGLQGSHHPSCLCGLPRLPLVTNPRFRSGIWRRGCSSCPTLRTWWGPCQPSRWSEDRQGVVRAAAMVGGLTLAIAQEPKSREPKRKTPDTVVRGRGLGPWGAVDRDGSCGEGPVRGAWWDCTKNVVARLRRIT